MHFTIKKNIYTLCFDYTECNTWQFFFLFGHQSKKSAIPSVFFYFFYGRRSFQKVNRNLNSAEPIRPNLHECNGMHPLWNDWLHWWRTQPLLPAASRSWCKVNEHHAGSWNRSDRHGIYKKGPHLLIKQDCLVCVFCFFLKELLKRAATVLTERLRRESDG